jgi:hypothetical protein
MAMYDPTNPPVVYFDYGHAPELNVPEHDSDETSYGAGIKLPDPGFDTAGISLQADHIPGLG